MHEARFTKLDLEPKKRVLVANREEDRVGPWREVRESGGLTGCVDELCSENPEGQVTPHDDVVPSRQDPVRDGS